jgi:hypothetical protein
VLSGSLFEIVRLVRSDLSAANDSGSTTHATPDAKVNRLPLPVLSLFGAECPEFPSRVSTRRQPRSSYESMAPPRKPELLHLMDLLRPLICQVCRAGTADCSDDAIADALVVTATDDSESWFHAAHLRAACGVLISRSQCPR